MTVTRYDVSGGVATITLASPGNRNALSSKMLDSIGDRLDRALADEAVRVVILTNDGPAFCAGADLKSAGGAPSRHNLISILQSILDAPKPIVGRVAGHCMGGGVGLAAACDMSLAVEDAQFGFTEVRIGVAPAIISVVCLPKIRRADALELFLSGERVSACRAAQIGLINRAVDVAELDAAVAAVTASLLAGGPEALKTAKRLVTQVPSRSRDEAFEWAGRLSGELFASEEAREGTSAFRERRPARWVPG